MPPIIRTYSSLRRNRELANANTQLNTEQVKTALSQAYYLYLLYQSNYDYAQRNQANADTLLHITQVRFDNQYIDELDINRSKSAQLQAQNQLDQSKVSVEKALNNLKLLAGINVKDQVVIQDKLVLQDVPLAEAITANAFARPDDQNLYAQS
jgi:outer membrane protein TolC